MDTITLQNLQFDTIVGILPSERVTPQPMEIDLHLGFPLGPIGDTGDLGLGIDYAAVEQQITALAQEGRFWLIETLALAATRWLLLKPTPDEERGQIDRARIHIRKPTILGGRATPGVVMERDAPAHVTVEVHEGVERVTLAQTDVDGAWRLRLAPGASWPLEPHHGGLLIAGTVAAGGVVLRAGDRVPRGAVLTADGSATLLIAGAT